MKQVFPNIRPRRLGTRGNSRYCYAAMRKATKLEGPSLPELGKKKVDTSALSTASSGSGNFQEQHEKSWQLVKSWAENLLSTSLESIDQLAEHIENQQLNSASSSATNPRHLLQKKLQRDMKEKRKLNVSFFAHTRAAFFLLSVIALESDLKIIIDVVF